MPGGNLSGAVASWSSCRSQASWLKISKWLHVDLPRKAEAATGLPVLHISAQPSKVPAS